MAKRIVTVLVDIEFPDEMLDNEHAGEGSALAGFKCELDKMVRDGCSAEGFTYDVLRPASLLVMSQAERVYDLVQT